MKYPAACCRQCSAAVLPLSEALVTPQGSHILHLTAAVPSSESALLRVEGHPNPGMAISGSDKERLRCLKLSKVYCQACNNDLGNVQRNLDKNGAILEKQWFFNTQGVGFCFSPTKDQPVVHALPGTENFVNLANGVGVEQVIEMLHR